MRHQDIRIHLPRRTRETRKRAGQTGSLAPSLCLTLLILVLLLVLRRGTTLSGMKED